MRMVLDRERCLVLSDDSDLTLAPLQAEKENMNPTSSLEDAMDGRKHISTSETSGQKTVTLD